MWWDYTSSVSTYVTKYGGKTFFLGLSAGIGVFTISGGALLGFIRGKIAEGDAIEYVISPNDWQINLRDISN